MTASVAKPVRPVPRDTDRVAPWVLRLARLLDSRYRIPGTPVRFGLDPIIGLIPGLGDTITAVIGATMIREAVRLDLGSGVIGRMVLNLGADWLLGLVPGLDLILDTVFKAHERNARLLLEANAERQKRRGPI